LLTSLMLSQTTMLPKILFQQQQKNFKKFHLIVCYYISRGTHMWTCQKI